MSYYISLFYLYNIPEHKPYANTIPSHLIPEVQKREFFFENF